MLTDGRPDEGSRLLGTDRVTVDRLSVEHPPVVSFQQFLVPRSELPPEHWSGITWRDGTRPRFRPRRAWLRPGRPRSGPARWRPGLRPVLVGLDVVACAGGVLAGGPSTAGLLFTALLLTATATGGLYRSRLSPSMLDDLPRLTGRLLSALALTFALLPRPEVVVTAAVTAALAGTLRAAVYELVRSSRRAGRVRHPTLILGAGQVGRYLADALVDHPRYGLAPIGFLDEGRSAALLTEGDLPLLGAPHELAAVVERHGVRNLIVAFGSIREPALVDLLRTCDRLRCEIFVVPRLFELHHAGRDLDSVWGIPLVRLRRATHRSVAWRVKRLVDVTVAGVALPLLGPLLLAVAAAVRCGIGGEVLFRQERVGVDGRRFELLKFRTVAPVSPAESATTWSIAGDARVGAVGRFLRRTSLDELPQLFNVLRGDMSLVGPRPERPHFVEAFLAEHPHYLARHRVPCGLTGLAQVNRLRGDTSIAERALFDNYYIENWSLWLDVTIMARTALSVLRAEGS